MRRGRLVQLRKIFEKNPQKKMKKPDWKKKIKAASKDAGTYQTYFEPIIDTLAGIMAMRDDAKAQYDAAGGLPVVEHTLDRGQKNMKVNPALKAVMDLDAQALAYWRDLGLTPAGLKKINDEAMKERKRSALAEALITLGG